MPQNPEYRRQHYLENRERNLAKSAAYKATHKDEIKAKRRAQYLRNRERIAALTKAYREARPEMYAQAFAKRRASRRNATPSWADHVKIAAIYAESARLTRETGVPHEVDHEVPLQGKTVCGLHWEANLQIVPRTVNRSKLNSFTD